MIQTFFVVEVVIYWKEDIIDKLQLCSEEDVKLLEQIVELMVTRNQSAWTRDPDNP